MELGYIGLGKMGRSMVERLREKGHSVVVFDRDPDATGQLAARGAQPALSIASLAAALAQPRRIWIMVPHQAVDSVLAELAPRLSPGDIVVDGGNSPYQESVRRGSELGARGVQLLDAGVSGGPAGARNGACIMVGGSKESYGALEGLFRDLAAEGAYAYVGPQGAGHFVKMVHNGIEYGMMQALAEGFTLLHASPFRFDLEAVAGLYGRRSVIESRLVEWLEQAYARYGRDLGGLRGAADQSGEGAWTVEAAEGLGVAVPAIRDAVAFRLASQGEPSYTGKVISALRGEFGGHEVREKPGT